MLVWRRRQVFPRSFLMCARCLANGRVISQTLKNGRKCILVAEPAGKSLRVTSTITNKATQGPISLDANGTVDPDSHSKIAKSTPARIYQNIIERTRYHLAHTFLPAGYPHTVGVNYEKYVLCLATQNLLGSCNGVLASTFLLYGIGLGKTGAGATAGAINWVLKDGIGQLGTLYFGKRISHNFDVYTKKWWIGAAILLDVATGMEIMAYQGATYFLAIGSFANMLKGLAWMAGGSTRTAFNVSFTENGSGRNIADLTAKATSQAIFTGIVGTALGVFLASLVGQSTAKALVAYTTLTAAHLYCTNRTVKCIPLASLNPTRLHLLAECYLDSVGWGDIDSPSLPDPPIEFQLPSPLELASKEPVFFSARLSRDERYFPKIKFGVEIYSQLAGGEPEQLDMLLTVFSEDAYMVNISNNGRAVCVVLGEGATEEDSLRAYLHAVLLQRGVKRQGESVAQAKRLQWLQAGRLQGLALIKPLTQSLAASGWDVSRVPLEERRQRAVW